MRRPVVAALALPLLCAVTGCPPTTPREPPQFLPRHVAIARVNENNARIGPGIRGKGITADIRIRDDRGQRRQFLLDGALVFVKPRSLYFDLRQLGSTAVRVGSNPDEYWLWIKPERDTVWWGRYDRLDGLHESDIPIRPDRLIDALGVGTLPFSPAQSGSPLYRVTPDWHQLVFFEIGDDGHGVIEKEYWLDRRPPFLIRQIVYRDAQGREVMAACLDSFIPAVDDPGVLLPSRIRAYWPREDGFMDLRIRRWENRSVTLPPDAPAFARPSNVTESIQVDAGPEPPV
jgi:hypothetical protein